MSDRQKFSRGGGEGQDPRGSSNGSDFGLSGWDEADQEKPKRDFKKTFLVGGLAILSWVATYVGMLELIEANMGDLPLVHKVIIGFSVAMLMTMIVWLLDQMFKPNGFVTKALYASGYIFLSLISIGFGFGFYWKVLESRSEGTRGAEMAIGQVQTPLQTAAARLDSLQTTLGQLQGVSSQKAETERSAGTSCPASRPGDGPRRKLRDDDAGRFAFASDFVKGRIGQVKTDMALIDGELQKLVKADASIIDKGGTRNEFMKSLGRKLDLTVTNFNAFRGDPQLKQIRIDLSERAEKTQFVDSQGKTFTCPDQQLATMIKSVVASIDALPQLEKPKIVTVEGSDATIEAFRRLTATFYGALSFKLPPSADELRDLQKKAINIAEGGTAAKAQLYGIEGAGLSKRDYVPLAIAIFVDICLLLVSIGKGQSRMQGLLPKMKEAERGPVIQILSRFNEIHRDRQIRENFEIFRHVVFDFHGDYYAAIPLIAPYSVDRRRPNAYGPADVEALQQEAHLLANLFTSFEKERLFSRVVMPLIPTSKIQKKLWAQGSKFAHAEAFRLYKFKDGAWQDMILGAIMGAAKRVENEKRTRRVENDVFTRHTPDLAAGPRTMPDPTALSGVEDFVSRPAMAATAKPFAFSPSSPRPQSSPSSGRPMAPPPPPRGEHTGTEAVVMTMPALKNRAARDQAAQRNRRQEAPLETEVAAMSANSNTAPVMSRTDLAQVFQGGITNGTVGLSTPTDTESVEIAAVERRVTFRVPMSEAQLPQSIRGALNAAHPIEDQSTSAPQLSLEPTKTLAPQSQIQLDADVLDTLAHAIDVRPTASVSETQNTVVTSETVDVDKIASRFGHRSRV
ncbi:MAG: hypothetical protein ABL898_00675 [Hyphomicrobiaceae bacterium]